MQKMSQREELAKMLSARARKHTLTPEQISRAMEEKDYDASGLDALYEELERRGVQIAEEDPELLLLQRLIAYKQFKETAQRMAEFEKNAREVFGKLPEEYPLPPPEIEIDGLTIEALWEALKRVQERAPKEAEEAVFQLRNIHRDNFTVEGCMEAIESRLSVGTVRFTQLFSGTPDREEVVTLFMALLELLKLGKAHVMQTGNFGEMTLLPGRRESDLGEE